jgi:hypothetical protein
MRYDIRLFQTPCAEIQLKSVLLESYVWYILSIQLKHHYIDILLLLVHILKWSLVVISTIYKPES